MIYKVVFNRELPDLNDVLEAAHRIYHYRGSARAYGDAALKRREQAKLESDIRKQLGGVRIKHPVTLDYFIYEGTYKRDWDNVLSVVTKYVQDALVRTGVLQNDNQRWVKGFTQRFGVDRERPRIELTITEIIEGEDADGQ